MFNTLILSLITASGSYLLIKSSPHFSNLDPTKGDQGLTLLPLSRDPPTEIQ
jgi:hypothetical protein